MRVRNTLKTIFSQAVLNPFDTVRYENDGYYKNADLHPNSRTMHTSWVQKIEDTYEVLRGGTNGINIHFIYLYLKAKLQGKPTGYYKSGIGRASFKLKTRPGLFDYATLGIFRLAHQLSTVCTSMFTSKAKSPSRAKSVGLFFAKAAIFLPFIVTNALHIGGNNFLRPLVSGILTIPLIPFALISHGIAKGIRRYKKDNLPKKLNMKVNKGDNSTRQMKAILSAAKINIRDLSIKVEHQLSTTKLKVEFHLKHPNRGQNSLFITNTFDRENETDKKQLEALAEVYPTVRREAFDISSLPRHRWF